MSETRKIVAIVVAALSNAPETAILSSFAAWSTLCRCRDERHGLSPAYSRAADGGKWGRATSSSSAGAGKSGRSRPPA